MDIKFIIIIIIILIIIIVKYVKECTNARYRKKIYIYVLHTYIYIYISYRDMVCMHVCMCMLCIMSVSTDGFPLLPVLFDLRFPAGRTSFNFFMGI